MIKKEVKQELMQAVEALLESRASLLRKLIKNDLLRSDNKFDLADDELFSSIGKISARLNLLEVEPEVRVLNFKGVQVDALVGELLKLKYGDNLKGYGLSLEGKALTLYLKEE